MDGSISRWFDREIAGCSLADRRLTKRLRSLLERRGDAMGASIPLACQDGANTKAAYRFFSNQRISGAAILAGHFDATRERFAATEGPILVLQDTTEFTYQRERRERIGLYLSRQQRQGQGWPFADAHCLRASDAFELGGHDRGPALGSGGDQVLDPREVQRHRCPQEEN